MQPIPIPESWDQDYQYVARRIIRELHLLDEALKMPPNERIELAQLIMASIDCEDEKIRNFWLNEVKDRRQAVKDGRTKLIDFDNLYHED